VRAEGHPRNCGPAERRGEAATGDPDAERLAAEAPQETVERARHGPWVKTHQQRDEQSEQPPVAGETARARPGQQDRANADTRSRDHPEQQHIGG